MAHGNSSPSAVVFWFVLLDFAIQWTACLFSAVYQLTKPFPYFSYSREIHSNGAFLRFNRILHVPSRRLPLSRYRRLAAPETSGGIISRLYLGRSPWNIPLHPHSTEGEGLSMQVTGDQPVYLMMFWTVQGMWVLLVSLPLLMLNAYHPQPQWLSATDVAGMAIWLTGFLIETISDHQKLLFSLRQENEGRWISSGLWSWSQHPNYFGEILLWFGLYLLTFSGLSPTYRLICLASPLFTFYALVRMSGIPLLDKASQQRWGKDAAYRAYRESTSILIPWPWPVKKAHAQKHSHAK
ncbi:unnamed protein product [Closterium sp. Yama58-4]|nr:unnamed protein product [Closterium sp. Yama58-4]